MVCLVWRDTPEEDVDRRTFVSVAYMTYMGQAVQYPELAQKRQKLQETATLRLDWFSKASEYSPAM